MAGRTSHVRCASVIISKFQLMRLLPLLFLLLASCSDNVLYNETKPRMFINVLKNRPDTISEGDTVNFQAIINPSPEDAADFFWTIKKAEDPDSSSYSSLEFNRIFHESGLYNIRFYAMDFFGDTKKDSLSIYALPK